MHLAAAAPDLMQVMLDAASCALRLLVHDRAGCWPTIAAAITGGAEVISDFAGAGSGHAPR